MKANQQLGKCELCFSQGSLIDSHFMPNSAYKIVKQVSQAVPIVINGEIAMQADKQVKDYLLCTICEERFSKSGESWVMANCFRGDNNFKLKSLLEGREALKDTGNFKVYSAASIKEIDTEKLVYFASSIIWRGAVHQWRMLSKPLTVLEIGPKYKEELRCYLLGQSLFPRNAVVWVSVILNPDLSSTFVPPYGEKDKEKMFWKYHFTLLGITFTFLLGNRIEPLARQMCTYRSPEKFIYSGTDVGDNLIRDFAPSFKSARPVGNLKDWK